jgi:hypothetical protein
LENAHLDKRFQTKTFVGNSIIVKLEKFDYLTPSEVIEGAHIINPLYILNVATPDHPKGKTIANPLPYSYIGTVVAIGDEVKNYREKNGLMPIIPGDTVELTWFDLKEYRYYPDKNRLDWMTLDNPHAPNFEGFAKVPAQFVEAIVPAGMYEEVYGSRAERFNTMAETYTEADYRRSH